MIEPENIYETDFSGAFDGAPAPETSSAWLGELAAIGGESAEDPGRAAGDHAGATSHEVNLELEDIAARAGQRVGVLGQVDADLARIKVEIERSLQPSRMENEQTMMALAEQKAKFELRQLQVSLGYDELAFYETRQRAELEQQAGIPALRAEITALRAEREREHEAAEALLARIEDFERLAEAQHRQQLAADRRDRERNGADLANARGAVKDTEGTAEIVKNARKAHRKLRRAIKIASRLSPVTEVPADVRSIVNGPDPAALRSSRGEIGTAASQAGGIDSRPAGGGSTSDLDRHLER